MIKKQFLHLKLDIENDKYSGITIIYFNQKNEGQFALNCNSNLKILSVEGVSNECESSIKTIFSHHNKKLLVECQSSECQIIFEGQINCQQYQGLFKIGDQFLTLFQPDYSSSVFPCLESFSQTVFQLKLTIPNHYKAISNTNILNVGDAGDGLIDIVFNQTIMLPIYVIGWYIYPQKKPFYYNDVEINSRPFRIGCNLNYPFLTEIAQLTIVQLELVLECKFPSDKLDFIIVPILTKTESIGMENHGLIVLSNELYINPKESVKQDYINVVVTIIHEIIHHYFGNLVTCKNWNQLWFNEGVTTWLSYIIADRLFPHLEIEYYVVSKYKQTVIETDLGVDSHPILVACDVSNANAPLFDTITYDKTAQLLFQLDHYFGNKMVEILKKILVDYMYNTIDFDLFLKCVKDVTLIGEDEINIIRSWFRYTKPGLLSMNSSKIRSESNQLLMVETICSGFKRNVRVNRNGVVIGEKDKLVYSRKNYYFVLTNQLQNVIFDNPLDRLDFLYGLIQLFYSRHYSLKSVIDYLKITSKCTKYFRLVFSFLDQLIETGKEKRRDNRSSKYSLIGDVTRFFNYLLNSLFSTLDWTNRLSDQEGKGLILYYGGKYNNEKIVEMSKNIGLTRLDLQFSLEYRISLVYCLAINCKNFNELNRYLKYSYILLSNPNIENFSKLEIDNILENIKNSNSYYWLEFINFKYLTNWANNCSSSILSENLNNLPIDVVKYFLVKRCNSSILVEKIKKEYPSLVNELNVQSKKIYTIISELD